MASMEINQDDTIRNLTTEGFIRQVNFQIRKLSTRHVSVCLGLLCAILLAGNIGQGIYHASPPDAGLDELQTLFHELQTQYKTLNISQIDLQTSYDSLQEEREELQTHYNTLKNASDEVSTHCSYLALTTLEMIQTFQEKIKKMKEKIRSMLCQTGWQKLDLSCYFVSTVKKNWTSSRKDCIAKGADLVIINSRKEQAFINNILKSGNNAWIGLSDSLVEGNWTWVNGDPVTITYWGTGQPNSFNGNQDCGEFVQEKGGGEWNDDDCSEFCYSCH